MTEKLSEKPDYQQIASEISLMAQKDQVMRARFEKTRDPDLMTEIEELDSEHTKILKNIVEQIGWPRISRVGKEASHNAWLLIQHADDLEFQKKCLQLMKVESEGDLNKRNIAFLEDRIRISEGKPQLYGTQFYCTQNDPTLRPHPIRRP